VTMQSAVKKPHQARAYAVKGSNPNQRSAFAGIGGGMS